MGIDIKKAIDKSVKEAYEEFLTRDDVTTEFQPPVISYIDSKSPLFDMFYEKGLSNHPKGVYSPGNTIIVYYVPVAGSVEDSNRSGGTPSPEWTRAFTESMWLVMKLNGVIISVIDRVGRISTCANTPTDWNEETYHEEWSHKMAAYAAGMGEFGPAGSFHTKWGFGGRLSAVITDGLYADKPTPLEPERAEEIYKKILHDCCFEGAENVSCSDEMINACPAGAISKTGIDREKCQCHCKTIDKYIPSPDVCGKCFPFKNK